MGDRGRGNVPGRETFRPSASGLVVAGLCRSGLSFAGPVFHWSGSCGPVFLGRKCDQVSPQRYERTQSRVWRRSDLPPSGRGRQPVVPRAGPGRGFAADAPHAAGHPEPGPAFGGHDHLQPQPQSAHRYLQRAGRRQRSVPAQPSRQGRKPDEGIRRPGGHRPRPLRHLRRRRPQLRPAVRAAPPAKAQVVQLCFQRATGQLSRARANCWPKADNHLARETDTEIMHARDQPRAVGR